MGERDEKGGHLELERWTRQYNSSPSNLEKTTSGKYISVSLSFAVLFKKTKLWNCTFMDSFVLVLAVLQITIEHLTISVSLYIHFLVCSTRKHKSIWFDFFFFFLNHKEHLTWGPATGGSLTGLITKLMGWSHYSTNATNL